MGRRSRANPSLTAALCVSLTAHGLGLSAVAWWFVTHGPPTWIAGPTPIEIARHHAPPPPLLAPPPKPKRRPPPPPPPVPFDQADPLRDDSGEAKGHGTANRSTAGAQPMRGQRARMEQADLARTKPPDPTLIDPAAARAAQAGRAVPEDALPSSPVAPQHGVSHPDFVAAADAAAAADPAVQPRPAAARALGPLPTAPPLSAPAEDAPPPMPSGTRSAVAKSSPTLTPPPPARETRGRLASASDTESVPFAAETTITFHAGRLEGRQGLKVDAYTPRWGLASEDDLTAMGELHGAFGVRTNPDGSPASAETLKSSGSGNVDQDITRALYRFTFPVQKDKDGHPLATYWTIVYD